MSDAFQVSRLIHQIFIEQARYPADLIRAEINQMREQLGVGTEHYTFVHFRPDNTISITLRKLDPGWEALMARREREEGGQEEQE